MKLLKLPEGYIIVSDEVRTLNLTTADTIIDEYNQTGGFVDLSSVGLGYGNLRKIIASTFHPELPQIEFDLSDEHAKKIGWIDIVKLSREHQEFEQSTERDLSHSIISGYGYMSGFYKAKESLSDKMFSLEDIKYAIKIGIKIGKYMNSLSKPKQWNIEIEMDKIPADRAPNGWDVFPKITEGKIKVTKIL